MNLKSSIETARCDGRKTLKSVSQVNSGVDIKDPNNYRRNPRIIEEIITALFRIRWIFVIARNSSFTYKGQPVDVKKVWIRWLAVRSRARGTGIGQYLVEAAIERLKGFDRISVDTFRAENIGGRAARRLYERVGFVAGPLVEVGGVPRQRYVLTLV